MLDARGPLLRTLLDPIDDEPGVRLQRTVQEPRDVGIEQHDLLVAGLDAGPDAPDLLGRGFEQQHIRLQ